MNTQNIQMQYNNFKNSMVNNGRPLIDTPMPDFDFENKKRITYMSLDETPSNWIYPHIDAVANHYNRRHREELDNFRTNYIPLYALKNKFEILQNMVGQGDPTWRDQYDGYDVELEDGQMGGMKNQKVKKCEKKKVVLGKERCIYKVSGSKKDYMKYKGKLVPVTDYVKYMKKKN